MTKWLLTNEAVITNSVGVGVHDDPRTNGKKYVFDRCKTWVCALQYENLKSREEANEFLDKKLEKRNE